MITCELAEIFLLSTFFRSQASLNMYVLPSSLPLGVSYSAYSLKFFVRICVTISYYHRHVHSLVDKLLDNLTPKIRKLLTRKLAGLEIYRML